jgi:hypothetical protein
MKNLSQVFEGSLLFQKATAAFFEVQDSQAKPFLKDFLLLIRYQQDYEYLDLA